MKGLSQAKTKLGMLHSQLVIVLKLFALANLLKTSSSSFLSCGDCALANLDLKLMSALVFVFDSSVSDVYLCIRAPKGWSLIRLAEVLLI